MKISPRSCHPAGTFFSLAKPGQPTSIPILLVLCAIAGLVFPQPTATITGHTGTVLPVANLPHGAAVVNNFGGNNLAIFQEGLGASLPHAPVKAFTPSLAAPHGQTGLGSNSFDICHSPIVLLSGLPTTIQLAVFPCGVPSVAVTFVNIPSTTYTATTTAGGTTTATPYFYGRNVYDSATYVYFLKNSTTTRANTNDVVLYKYDLTPPALPANLANPPIATTPVLSTAQGREILWYADPFILINYAATSFAVEGVAIFEKVGMTVVGTFNMANLNSVMVRFKPSQNYFFIANENTATGYGFSKVLINNSPVGVTSQGNWLTGAQDICSMWVSPLMGIVYVQPNNPVKTVQLVDAYTLTTVGSTLALFETPVRYFPTLWSSTSNTETYFFVGTAGSATPSLASGAVIWLDYCVVQSQNPCVQCQTGRYLNSNTAGNLCITPNDFPAGYGINTLYMWPCLGSLTSGCLACPTVYSFCTLCDSGNGFYLEPVSGQCYSIPTMPPQYGLNASATLVMPCANTTGHCQLCAADNAVCAQCQTGYYPLVGTSQPCLGNSSGFGLQNSSGQVYLAPCFDVNCASCTNNWSICTQCETNFTLVDTHCFLTKSMYLKLLTTPLLDTSTGTFNLNFDKTVFNNTFINQFYLNVYSMDKKLVSNSSFSFTMTKTGDSTISGTIKSTSYNLRTLSTVVLTQINLTDVVFYNQNSYYPSTSITLDAVYKSTTTQIITQNVLGAGLLGLALASSAAGAGVGSSIWMIQIIDNLEHLLYIDGLRIPNVINFLHFIRGSMYNTFPGDAYNYPEGCVPDNNFDRGKRQLRSLWELLFGHAGYGFKPCTGFASPRTEKVQRASREKEGSCGVLQFL